MFIKLAVRTALLLSISILCACGPNAKKGLDSYDASQIELKSPPSKTSMQRHTGPFAAGASLNFTAELKPTDPSPLKNVQLDTTHKVV